MRKLIFCAAIFLLASLDSFAREIPVPMIKIPSRVECVDWSTNGTQFAYSEKGNITVRSGADYSTENFLEISDADEAFYSIQFVQNQGLEQDQLMTFSDKSIFRAYRPPETVPFIERDFYEVIDGNEYTKAVAFAPEGNFVAIGKTDGSIDLFFQLYLTKKLFKNSFKRGETQDDSQTPFVDTPPHISATPLESELLAKNQEVISVAFSADSQKVTALRNDGSITVWAVPNGEILAEFSDAFTGVDAIAFTNDSQSIIYATGEKQISIKNFSGETLGKIKCREKIVSFTQSADSRQIVTLASSGRFLFYSTDDSRYEAYIPSWNESGVSAWAFTQNGERLLVGHEDGTIYILSVEEVVYAPGEKPRVYALYYADGSGKRKKRVSYEPNGDGQAEENSSGAESQSEKAVASRGQILKKRNEHSIELRSEFSMATGIYGAGAEISAGYTNAKLLSPVYFGALLNVVAAFPSGKFPYTYYDAFGGEIRSPFLASFGVMIPIGICVMPFKSDV